MENFKNKAELLLSYSMYLMASTGCDKSSATITAPMMAKYNPYLYRGGWVIPGFGYSTERIGVYCTEQDCGFPEAVPSRRERVSYAPAEELIN